jgi:hypothetical protein
MFRQEDGTALVIEELEKRLKVVISGIEDEGSMRVERERLLKRSLIPLMIN